MNVISRRDVQERNIKSIKVRLTSYTQDIHVVVKCEIPVTVNKRTTLCRLIDAKNEVQPVI